MSSAATSLIDVTESRMTASCGRQVVELGVVEVDPGEVGQVRTSSRVISVARQRSGMAAILVSRPRSDRPPAALDQQLDHFVSTFIRVPRPAPDPQRGQETR